MAEQRIVDVQKVKAYRPPGQRRQWRLVLVIGALVTALAAGAYLLLAPREQTYHLRSFEEAAVVMGTLVQTTQASGTVVMPVQLNLVSPQAGTAAKLAVAEGDSVAAGQALAVLSAGDLEESLEDLMSDLSGAERSLEKLLLQNLITTQRKLRQIDGIAGDIVDATADRDYARSMVRTGVSPQSELDSAQKTLDSLQTERTELVLQLEEDEQLWSLDELVSEATIANLRVRILRQQELIDAMSITSPISGAVLSVEPALSVPGSKLNANQTLFTIADPGSAVVELEVLEQYAAALEIRQRAELTVGTTALSGTVVSIGQVAQQSADGLGATVLVRVAPESSAGPLLAGASAVGVFEVGATESALLLPRGPYLTTGSQRYLYRIDGDEATKITVTFGQIEGNTVPVLSGVSVGDRIITSGYQNFIEHETIKIEGGTR